MNRKLNTLIQLNSKLDRVIQFDDITIKKDDDGFLSGAGKVAGYGAVGVGGAGLAGAGLYAAGARRQGVQWSNMGAKIARDYARGGITGPGGIGSTFIRGSKVAGGALKEAGQAVGAGVTTAAKGVGEAGLNLLKKIRV